MRILVADHEKEAEEIIPGLISHNFSVDHAIHTDQAFQLVASNTYDLAVVNANIPKDNGLEFSRQIRERGCTFPIIICSAIDSAPIKIQALNLGADDYLLKPFSLDELMAHISARLRREKPNIASTLRAGDLELDVLARKVTRDNQVINLNKKEFALLEYLMRNQGISLTRNMILEHVWDINADTLTNTVDVHISFLREKIDKGHDKKLIHTVHGHGYKLEA